MKNKFTIIFFIFFIFLSEKLFAENIFITAKNITIDKNDNTSIFENQVVVKTQNKVIQSDYAKYDKLNGYLLLKENITLVDEKNNKLFTNFAEYYENEQIFNTKGYTKVETEELYTLQGEDIFLNNKKKLIKSEKNSTLVDQEGNKIFIENFEYLVNDSLFKSLGFIEIQDTKNNIYQFSQVYIDTKKKEILGTDSKAYINDKNFKISQKNDPRIFSNTINIKDGVSTFDKSIFTICQFRDDEECPPWTIQSKKMLHDNIKKTIYYDHAIVKVYDFPIFYFPKLSHPDPSVDRRSGFLIPSFSNTKSLGGSISIPYFFDLGVDKNLIVNNRLYFTENPLFLGEYHQAFKNSNLITNFGYTEGYKKTNSKKTKGEKNHFFAKFEKDFKNENNFQNNIELKLQNVSDDKYLKTYKIKTNIVDYDEENLENSFKFTQERDDLFFGFNASVYESLGTSYNDKYEYILPEISLDKKIFSNSNLGYLNLQSNYTAHNYDTNKTTSFFVNDLNYETNNKVIKDIFDTKILANLKNINYETKNVDLYKNDATNEVFGSLGLFSQINLEKLKDNFSHFLTPKIFIRYAPGSMRQEDDGDRLIADDAFDMNRILSINNYETGASATLGLDYNIRNKENISKLDFSLAQVINEKENNKMSDISGLNEKLSDLVGNGGYNFNNNFKLNYSFALDQNYNDFNYHELGTTYNNGPLNINFDYLRESKHIGDQDFFKTKISLKNDEKGLLTFSNKRNLITNSSEFYDLSYEYINDCLRAGLVYRREFYTDSESEPESSLMFQVTLIPFGDIEGPKFEY